MNADAGSPLNRATIVAGRGGAPDYDLAKEAAVITLRLRRAREMLFGNGLFGDGAWDLLLALLIARVEERRTTMKQACAAACVPTTTAQRCITRLEARRLVHRRRYEVGKRIWLELDEAAFERLACLLIGSFAPKANSD